MNRWQLLSGIGFSRETEPTGSVYAHREKDLFFRKRLVCFGGLTTPNPAGKPGRLETQGRVSAGAPLLAEFWRFGELVFFCEGLGLIGSDSLTVTQNNHFYSKSTNGNVNLIQKEYLHRNI